MKNNNGMVGRPSGTYNFQAAVEAAKVEARMLSNKMSITELANSFGVSRATMDKFLRTGAHNKAYEALRKRNWL